MAPSAGELTGRIAGKARQYASPAALQAVAAEQVWNMRGPCTPQGAGAHVPGVLPQVSWPMQYEWPLAEGWVRPLREGIAAFTTVHSRAIDQPYKGIVLFEVGYPDQPAQTVAVDYYDYTFINDECLEQVALYFKMQHLRAGYGERKVVPGGYVGSNPSIYQHYCRLRSLPRGGGSGRRVRTLRHEILRGHSPARC